MPRFEIRLPVSSDWRLLWPGDRLRVSGETFSNLFVLLFGLELLAVVRMFALAVVAVPGGAFRVTPGTRDRVVFVLFAAAVGRALRVVARTEERLGGTGHRVNTIELRPAARTDRNGRSPSRPDSGVPL